LSTVSLLCEFRSTPEVEGEPEFDASPFRGVVDETPIEAALSTRTRSGSTSSHSRGSEASPRRAASLPRAGGRRRRLQVRRDRFVVRRSRYPLRSRVERGRPPARGRSGVLLNSQRRDTADSANTSVHTHAIRIDEQPLAGFRSLAVQRRCRRDAHRGGVATLVDKPGFPRLSQVVVRRPPACS
jgi:hypothetical protein